MSHGVEKYFPRLWGTGISDAIFLYLRLVKHLRSVSSVDFPNYWCYCVNVSYLTYNSLCLVSVDHCQILEKVSQADLQPGLVVPHRPERDIRIIRSPVCIFRIRLLIMSKQIFGICIEIRHRNTK